MKKVLKYGLISLVTLLIVVIVSFITLFSSEISTLNSITRVSETDFFSMEYKGDYGFDAFLEEGASNDGELIQFVTQRLLKGIPLEFNIPDLGCSTFSAVTPEGERIYGRNFDLSYAPAMMVKTKPEKGYASLSMVNLSVLGYGENKLPDSFAKSIITLAAPYAPFDGVNEKGVAIGVLLIDTDPTDQRTDKVDITTTTAIRLVLDKAATVDEAVALLEQYDMHSSANSSYHFQISDAAGRSVVVEYVDNVFSVVEDQYTATNFLLTPGEWYNFGKGQDRYEKMVVRLKETDGILTPQEGMALLEHVSSKPKANPDPNKKPSTTQWSVVYNSSKATADVCIAMDYENVYPFSLH